MPSRFLTILRLFLVAIFIVQIGTILPSAVAAENPGALDDVVFLFDDNADNAGPLVQGVFVHEVVFISYVRSRPFLLAELNRQSLAAFSFPTTGPPSL